MMTPYESGHHAAVKGLQVGVNPYNPDNQPAEYEQWIDGWVDGHNEQLELGIGSDGGC